MNDLLLNELAHARLAELRKDAAKIRLVRRLRRIVRPLIPRQRGASAGSYPPERVDRTQSHGCR